MTIALTQQALTQMLGREVEEIHLTVAKSLVMGMELAILAETIGIPEVELRELTDSQDFKDVRLLVGAEYAKERVERDTGWDGLENVALRKLNKRVAQESDPDFLLRVAAVANRAQRRTTPPKESVLDPSQAAARVPLTLTRRYTEKLNGQGQLVERTETQQISVLNGSAVNPKFDEVRRLLTASAGPAPTEAKEYAEQTESSEGPDLTELMKIAEGLKK